MKGKGCLTRCFSSMTALHISFMVPVTQTTTRPYCSAKKASKPVFSRLEAFFACLHNFNFLYGLFMVPVTQTLGLPMQHPPLRKPSRIREHSLSCVFS